MFSLWITLSDTGKFCTLSSTYLTLTVISFERTKDSHREKKRKKTQKPWPWLLVIDVTLSLLMILLFRVLSKALIKVQIDFPQLKRGKVKTSTRISLPSLFDRPSSPLPAFLSYS